jgi:DNA polymerase-1
MIRELARSEWYGVKINMSKVHMLINEYEKEQEQVLLFLRSKTFPDFNPGSTPQVAKACQMLGFGNEILDPNSASGICTDKTVLTDLISKDLFFPNILRYRNLDKLLGTYLKPIESDLGADGNLRISWRQAGPETGRLSAPLLHQVPQVDAARAAAGKVIMRDIFEAPKGCTMVYADYSQVELRILAIESQDAEMLRLFKEGKDIHLATTAEILGIPEKGTGLVPTEDGLRLVVEVEAAPNRTSIGKGVNFGLAYGSKGHALVDKVQWVDIHGTKHNLTWDLLNQGMERWRQRFSGIADFTDTIPVLARKNDGIIVNRFGRERRFGSRLSDFKEGRKAAREAINFPIQSTATNITNGTIVRVSEEILKLIKQGSLKDDSIYMVLTVHDSILYVVKDYLVPWFTGVLKGIGERQVPELENNSFPMAIGVGNSWYEAEVNSK